jgi:hypothetical protein
MSQSNDAPAQPNTVLQTESPVSQRQLLIAIAITSAGLAVLVVGGVLGVLALTAKPDKSNTPGALASSNEETANPTFTRVADSLEKSRSEGPAYQGKSARAWIEQLKEPDPDRRLTAANAVLALGTAMKPYSANIEATIKDVLWDLLLSNIASLEQRQTIGSIEHPRASQQEENLRQQDLKEQKYSACLVALARTLEKADPERLTAMGLAGDKLDRFVHELSRQPATTSTFDKVADTISPAPSGGER